MSTIGEEAKAAAFSATLCAAAMLAHQVAAKAARDAFFLTAFDVTLLPRMIVVSAIVSVVVVLLSARAMTVMSPARVVPRAFVVSAVLLMGEWWLLERFMRAGTVMLYLHTIVFGSVLTSGFWSMVNERFDPHTAKRIVGRIASGGTLGALIGGLSAERIGANLSLEVMLPFLAALHLFCAWVVRDLRGRAEQKPRSLAHGDVESGFSVLAGSPYLRSMAMLVALGTASAALLDYLLKAEATAVMKSGEDLVRFFAALYASTGLVSFVVQTALSAKTLERLGLGRTVALLPLSTGVSSAVTILFPGLAAIAAGRGVEAMLRTSLYRSAYELLYTPVAPEKKRATKSIIDVLCDRFGDVAGGAMVAVVIAVAAPDAARVWVLTLAAVLSVFAMVVALRLQRGYVATLATSLVEMGADLEAPKHTLGEVGRVVQFTEMMLFDREQGAFLQGDPETLLTGTGLTVDLDPSKTISVPASSLILAAADRAALLDSGDPVRIRFALMQGKLTGDLVPRAIRLLALNEVMVDAIIALGKVVDREVDRLVASLLDPQEDFAVRRRLPRVLARSKEKKAIDGLTTGLFDQRFEVRFQCGRALSKIKDAVGEALFDGAKIMEAVEREVTVDRGVWESHRLLDQVTQDEATAFQDALLEDRASRSMQHVFNVLSLVLKKEPLEVAYRGLFTEDQTLRGTSLEYLGTTIPEPIRGKLWPFLNAGSAPNLRPRQEILDDLMRSRGSIMLKLEELEAIKRGKA
jgi:ATP:ADP antiporter, AAA family